MLQRKVSLGADLAGEERKTEKTQTPPVTANYTSWGIGPRSTNMQHVLFIFHSFAVTFKQKTIISVETCRNPSPVTRFYQVFRMPHLSSRIGPACVPKLEAEQRTLQFFGTALLLQSVCRFIEL